LNSRVTADQLNGPVCLVDRAWTELAHCDRASAGYQNNDKKNKGESLMKKIFSLIMSLGLCVSILYSTVALASVPTKAGMAANGD